MSEAVQNLIHLIARSTRHVVLNPIVTGALLWALTKAPPHLRGRLTSRITLLQDPKQYARIVQALKLCLALGSVSVLNKQLNHVALNSGRFRSEKARWNFSREVAVVTGGCSGIGELTVKRLINKGVRVAIMDIRQLPPSLQGFANIKFFACDITDPNAVYSTAEQIKETLGAPSILINNAGIFEPHTILSTSDEYLRKIFDVNVLSNWYTVKAFLPEMVRQNKGHIVTVASLASYVSVAGMADYTATKAAILSFHEALNQELRMHYNSPNVLTTSIHPIWVRTPLLAPVQESFKKNSKATIEPTVVADAIVDRIVSCSGGQVMIPSGLGRRASLLRALPNWVQESARSQTSKSIRESVK